MKNIDRVEEDYTKLEPLQFISAIVICVDYHLWDVRYCATGADSEEHESSCRIQVLKIIGRIRNRILYIHLKNFFRNNFSENEMKIWRSGLIRRHAK